MTGPEIETFRQNVFLYFTSAAAQVWAAIVVFYVLFARDVVRGVEQDLFALWLEWKDGLSWLHSHARNQVQLVRHYPVEANRQDEQEQKANALEKLLDDASLALAGPWQEAMKDVSSFRSIVIWMNAVGFFRKFNAGGKRFRPSDDDDARVFPDNDDAQLRVDRVANIIAASRHLSPLTAIVVGFLAISINLGALLAGYCVPDYLGAVLLSAFLINAAALGAVIDALTRYLRASNREQR